jgi:hypothetical protein
MRTRARAKSSWWIAAVAIAATALLSAGSALSARSALAAGGNDAAAPQPAGAVSITGTVQTATRTMAGQPSTVQIVSPDRGTYLVEDSGKGKELKEYVGRTVTVVARVKHKDGKGMLVVQDFRLENG